jgi:hypothetical protein
MGKRCGRRAKEWKNRIKVVENGRKVVENAKRLVFYDIPLIVACWISIRVPSGSIRLPAPWLTEFLDFA